MKKEKEKTGTTNAQGSGRKTSPSGASNTTANMNPEAEGLNGWASTENRRNTLYNLGDRLSRRYNSLTPTQKVVGATLLASAAVGTAYLTRDMWGAKSKSWISTLKSHANDLGRSSATATESDSEETESATARTGSRSGSGKIVM